MSNAKAKIYDYENGNFASNFHERLYSLLSEGLEKRAIVRTWAERLSCNTGTIRDGWLKSGTYPVSDMTMKICEISGVSADWLLLGKEPKYREPDKSGQKSVADLAESPTTDNSLTEMERRIEDRFQHLMNLNDRQWKQLDRIEAKLGDAPASAPASAPVATVVGSMLGPPGKDLHTGIWIVEMMKKLAKVEKLGSAARSHLEKSIDFILKGAVIGNAKNNH